MCGVFGIFNHPDAARLTSVGMQSGERSTRPSLMTTQWAPGVSAAPPS